MSRRRGRPSNLDQVLVAVGLRTWSLLRAGGHIACKSDPPRPYLLQLGKATIRAASAARDEDRTRRSRKQ